MLNFVIIFITILTFYYYIVFLWLILLCLSRKCNKLRVYTYGQGWTRFEYVKIFYLSCSPTEYLVYSLASWEPRSFSLTSEEDLFLYSREGSRIQKSLTTFIRISAYVIMSVLVEYTRHYSTLCTSMDRRVGELDTTNAPGWQRFIPEEQPRFDELLTSSQIYHYSVRFVATRQNIGVDE